jgi:hypothetical protein
MTTDVGVKRDVLAWLADHNGEYDDDPCAAFDDCIFEVFDAHSMRPDAARAVAAVVADTILAALDWEVMPGTASYARLVIEEGK